MVEAKMVIVFSCLLAIAAAERVAHPRVEPAALLQSDGGEVPDKSTSDEATVAARFGEQVVNMDNLKGFLVERSFSEIGQMEDLLTRVSCIIRLEEDMGEGLTTVKLQNYLENHELSTAGNRDDLLDRSCHYYSMELRVIAKMGKPISDVGVQELQSELTSIGFVSTQGTKPQLVFRLGKILRDLATIRKLLAPSFEPKDVKALLSDRNLSTEGSTDVQLARLADYLVAKDNTVTLPGVSPHCDMVLESALCIHGGRKVLAPPAKPQGLVGRWTFDDAHMLDSSGEASHAKETVSFGPGRNGFGHSAKFDGSTQMLEIPHSEAMESESFCVTFWMYLLSDSTGQWRTILHKGERDHQRTPTFFLEPLTRGIEMFVSTQDDSQPLGERVWSNTFIPLRRWTHVAGCVEKSNMRLYIDGILDAENTTSAAPVTNKGPIYVGNDPWRPMGGVAAYVDDLHWYNRVLTTDEIQAEAGAASLVEPSFVELGCMGCSLNSCSKMCREGYRLCSQRDLHSGGYHVARQMGWAATDTRIWKHEDGKAADTDGSGLCVCCRIGDAGSSE